MQQYGLPYGIRSLISTVSAVAEKVNYALRYLTTTVRVGFLWWQAFSTFVYRGASTRLNSTELTPHPSSIVECEHLRVSAIVGLNKTDWCMFLNFAEFLSIVESIGNALTIRLRMYS
jgi:hypothetical protein